VVSKNILTSNMYFISCQVFLLYRVSQENGVTIGIRESHNVSSIFLHMIDTSILSSNRARIRSGVDIGEKGFFLWLVLMHSKIQHRKRLRES